MRRWLKRIALALAVLVAGGLLACAVLAWRATRVPAWYAAAVEETPVDSDATINDQILPLQNWLARTSAGDLDNKSAAEKSHTLELTEDQINALIAKYRDNVHDVFEHYRVRLTPGRVDVGWTWVEQGRTLTVGADVARTNDETNSDPGGRPTIALGGVRVGNQGVPLSLFRQQAIDQVRRQLDSSRKRDVPPRIDDNDNAPGHTVERYYCRLLLDILADKAVSPEAFLPKQLSSSDWVATRITRLDVTDRHLKITFRFLTPGERNAVVERLSTALPAAAAR